MWVANWECSMLCYEVVANAWDVIYNAPRLGSSICAKTSENQMMSLGTMQVQLARDNRQTLIEKFKIKVVTQEKCAYTDNTDFLKVKSETKPEVDANELEAIGWHKQSEDNAFAILASKAKGIVPLYLLKAPEVAAMYMIRKEHRGLLNGITGGYEVEAEQREGAKIAGKCCEMDGALLKAMEELGGLPKDRWPLKMMVNIERMDRSRRRELRNSITYAAGWNDWGTWSNKSKGGLHFLMYGTKEEAFDVARKTIDIGTMGRGTSWKIADLSKKPKHETVEEEKTETERLQEMVKRVETEESYRNYLLYKIKILEKAIKTLEGSVK